MQDFHQIPQDEPSQAKDSARRRLLKAGVAATPVVFTVASRPVLGTTVCATVSGAQSLNLSNPQALATCYGLSPDYWQAHPDIWPQPYVSAQSTSTQGVAALGKTQITPATLFHSATTGFRGTFFGGKPLSEVLQMGGGGKTGVGQACATALLNAAAGRTPVLSETLVRSIWNEYDSRGYFEPTPGVQWRADDIVRYISTTIG